MDDQLTIDKIIAKYHDVLVPHYDGYTDKLYFNHNVYDGGLFEYRISIDIEKWLIFRKVILVIRDHDSVPTVVEYVSGKEARRVIKNLMDIKKVYEDKLASATLSKLL